MKTVIGEKREKTSKKFKYKKKWCQKKILQKIFFFLISYVAFGGKKLTKRVKQISFSMFDAESPFANIIDYLTRECFISFSLHFG